MENNQLAISEPVVVKDKFKALVTSEGMKKRFSDMLDKEAAGFITSLLSLKEDSLKDVDPMSVLGSALKAAALKLPIDQNLGYAWIVPYNGKKKDASGREVRVKEAQFQIGYKGYIQLAQRTGQYLKINAIEIYDGQLVSYDELTEDLIVDMQAKKSDKVVGFAAYFKMLNGFEKKVYWSSDKMEDHANKYSKNYQRYKSGLWKDDFIAMGKKTVLKNILSKWGLLSIEMRSAIEADSAVISTDGNTEQISYIDNMQRIEVIQAPNPFEKYEEIEGTPFEEVTKDAE